ncbi:MAG: putative sulfate exporter family transporter [Pseudomonadota bacterium]
MTTAPSDMIGDLRRRVGVVAPGLLIAFTIAAASRFVSDHYGAPAMLFALLIGMAFHFLTEDDKCAPGVDFVSGRLLRIGVALLGVRVSFDQLLSLGAKPLLMTPFLIGGTICVGLILAHFLSRPKTFGILTGGAVAICGASAALAISAAMSNDRNRERDTLFTVIAVTSLSTVAMVLYPILFTAFGLDDQQIGVLIGATIHDVAQVVGAGYAVSDEAGDAATYVKLLRVAFLPIVVLVVAAAFHNRADGSGGAPFPWFALAFAALLAANSFGLIPENARVAMEWTSRWFLIAAIAALGIKTSLKAMVDLGPRHFGIVVGETAFLFAAACAIVMFL